MGVGGTRCLRLTSAHSHAPYLVTPQTLTLSPGPEGQTGPGVGPEGQTGPGVGPEGQTGPSVRMRADGHVGYKHCRPRRVDKTIGRSCYDHASGVNRQTRNIA
jgi:hypothetical protein